MALDFFRSIPSKLQQRGLRGLAQDQGELDAEEERRRQEEERARQLEQVRAQYDQATEATTQQAQQTGLRDSLLDQARERFDGLTAGVGRLGQARDQAMQTPTRDVASGIADAARPGLEQIRQRFDQATSAVAGAAGDYGDWREEVQARPRDERPMEQRVDFEGLERETRQGLGLGAAAGATDAEAAKYDTPPEGPAWDAVRGVTSAPVLGGVSAQDVATGMPRAGRQLARSVDDIRGGAAALTDEDKTLQERATGAAGVALGTLGATVGAAGTVFGGPVGARLEEAARPAGQEVARGVREVGEAASEFAAPAGGLSEVARLRGARGPLGAAGRLADRLHTAPSGARVGEAAEEAGRLRTIASGVGLPAGTGIGAFKGDEAARERAAVEGREATLGERVTGGLAGAVRGADIGTMPGDLADLGAGAARMPRNLARGALGATGNLTPDMSTAEGLRGAGQTALAQGRAAVRGIADDLGGALSRERGAAGRPADALGITPSPAPEAPVDVEALRQELAQVNRQRGQAAQALGKARIKAGPPDRPPAGLTPETQGIWDAYADASRRTKEINDALTRSRQGAAQTDPAASLAEPTGEPPPNVPRQGRGSWQTPPGAEPVTLGADLGGPTYPPNMGTLTSGQQAPFYSALQRAVEQLPAGRLSPAQLGKQLLAQPDVKREQLVWSGLDDYLTGKLQANNGRGEAVTRDELAGWLRDHDVRVYEVQKGSAGDPQAQTRLEATLQEAAAASDNASNRLQALERTSENETWDILGQAHERLRQTEEGRLALDPTGMGYGVDVQDAASQFLWGYPNAPRDRSLFDFLGEEQFSRDPDDPYAAELTPEERQRGLGHASPLYAALTPEERTRLDAIRSEYRDAADAQNAAQVAYVEAEQAAGEARSASLPGGPAKWLDYANGGLYLPGAQAPEANAREFLLTLGPRPDMPDFEGAHWEEPNVTVHIRMTDRVTPDGKKVLLLEELQSDWHQAARKKRRDDQGQVLTDAQGKTKRVGYYPGRRSVEEIRAAPEWAELGRLDQAAAEANRVYDDYYLEGSLEAAKNAYQADQPGAIERARRQMIEAGLPEELLGRMNGQWMERPRDDTGNRLPEPTVLVRYAFPAGTTRQDMAMHGLVSKAPKPTRVEVVDWTEGWRNIHDPQAQRSGDFSEQARARNEEEDGLQRQTAGMQQEGDEVYHYTTRGADAVLHEMAELDPRIAPLKRAYREAEAEALRLQEGRSAVEQALQTHEYQYADLTLAKQHERADALRAEIARMTAEIEAQGVPRVAPEDQRQAEAFARRHMERNVRGVNPEDYAAHPSYVAAYHQYLSETGAIPATVTSFGATEAEQAAARASRPARGLMEATRKLAGIEQQIAAAERRPNTGGRPSAAPFQGEGWQRLALKRLLHLAAVEGYDALGVTPGDVQAQRYDPFRGQGIEALEYDLASQTLTVHKEQSRYGGATSAQPATQKVAPQDLPDYVGAGVAERLLDPEAQAQRRRYNDHSAAQGLAGSGVRLSKEDWEGGLVAENAMGAGMRQSYDERVPQMLTDLGRRFGAQTRLAPETDPLRALPEEAGVLLYPDRPPDEVVEEGSEDGTTRQRPNFQPAHLLEVTPQMRSAPAQDGMFPLFVRPPGQDGTVGRDGAVGRDGTFAPDRRADAAGEALGAVAGGVRGYQGAEEEDERRRARGEAGVSAFAKIGSALFGAGLGATGGKMAVRGARLAPKLGTPGKARGAALLDFVRSNPMAESLGVGRDGAPGAAGRSGAVVQQDYAEQWLGLDRSPARVLENRATTAEREAADTRRKWQAFQARVDKGVANTNERDEAEELAGLFEKADKKARDARAAASAQRTAEDAATARLGEAGAGRQKNALFEGLEGLRDPETGRPRKLGPVDRDQLNQALLEYKVRGLSVDVAAARAGIKKEDLTNVIDDLGIRRTNQQGGAILAERTGPPEEVGTPKPKVTMESLAEEDRLHDEMGDVWWRQDLSEEEASGLTNREVKKLRVERGLTPEGRRPKPKNPHAYVDLDGVVQYADSTYEAVMFRVLDELKKQGTVAYWQRGLVGDEAFAFNEAMLEQWRGLPVLTKEGMQAAFAPDFFVVTRDPQTGEFHMEVIEVKNTGIYARPEWRVPEKLSQGREFLEKNGVGYRLFTGDQIGRSLLASLQDGDLAPDADGRMGMPDPEQRQALLKALAQDFGKTQVNPRLHLGEWKPQTVPEAGAAPSPTDIPESRYPRGEEPAEEPLFPGEPAGLGRTFSERMGERPGQTIHEILAEYNRKGAGPKLVPDASEALVALRPKAEDAIKQYLAEPFLEGGNRGLTYNPTTGQKVPIAPGGGYVVSPFGHAEMVFRGEDVNPVALAAWLSEHRDFLDDPDVRVGFWYTPKGNKTTVDLVVEVPDPGEADALGRAADQEAIFHLGAEADSNPQIDLDYGEAGRLGARRTRKEEIDAFETWRRGRSERGGPAAVDDAAPDAGALTGGRPAPAGPPRPDVGAGDGPAGGLAGADAGVGGPGSEGRVPAGRPVLPTGARAPAPYRGRGAGGLPAEQSGRLLTGVAARPGVDLPGRSRALRAARRPPRRRRLRHRGGAGRCGRGRPGAGRRRGRDRPAAARPQRGRLRGVHRPGRPPGRPAGRRRPAEPRRLPGGGRRARRGGRRPGRGLPRRARRRRHVRGGRGAAQEEAQGPAPATPGRAAGRDRPRRRVAVEQLRPAEHADQPPDPHPERLPGRLRRRRDAGGAGGVVALRRGRHQGRRGGADAPQLRGQLRPRLRGGPQGRHHPHRAGELGPDPGRDPRRDQGGQGRRGRPGLRLRPHQVHGRLLHHPGQGRRVRGPGLPGGEGQGRARRRGLRRPATGQPAQGPDQEGRRPGPVPGPAVRHGRPG